MGPNEQSINVQHAKNKWESLEFFGFDFQNTLSFREELNKNRCLFEPPNNNNNNSPRFSGASKAEWFLHPRVQDLVDHQMALMEVTDTNWYLPFEHFAHC